MPSTIFGKRFFVRAQLYIITTRDQIEEKNPITKPALALVMLSSLKVDQNHLVLLGMQEC